MQLIDGDLVWSASDLIAAARCEYAFLRAADALLHRGPKPPKVSDALMEHAAELGGVHEERVLDSLTDALGEGSPADPRGVVRIRDAKDAGLHQAAAETLAVAQAGADVIHQAVLFDGRTLGFADFLIKRAVGDSHAYEVADAKLARRAKPQALLQIAVYAALAQQVGIPATGRGRLILGDRRDLSANPEIDLQRLAPIVAESRGRLERLLSEHEAGTDPVEWGAPGITACGRCDTCQEQVALNRDVLLVAGMRVSQRTRLRAAGITTIDELASYQIPINAKESPIPRRTLQNLQSQARMQLRQMGLPGAASPGPVTYEVLENAKALAGLPEPDPGDIFFDFEGDPLWEGKEGDWGLEYLFGVVEADDDGTTRFLPFWAHDRDGEKKALEEFLAYVAQRRRRHPDMHIYHYADYERSALLRLAQRHGTGEDEIDQLLRQGVLVDLFPLVKKSLRVSQDSYSIKKLEPLYMSDEELRSGAVQDAQSSVVEYAKYMAQVEGKEYEAARQTLEQIADYNKYDCVSTLRLRNWLLDLAEQHESGWGDEAWGGKPATQDGADASETALAESELVDPLRRHAEDPDSRASPEERDAILLIAAAVGYHRREDKPFWWAHYDRLVKPLDEIADRDAMIAEDVVVEEHWHRRGRQKKDRRILSIVGSLPPGSDIRAGRDAYLLYEPPLPWEMDSGSREGSRGYVKVKVLDIGSDEANRDIVRVEEMEKDVKHSDLPTVITAPPGPKPFSVKAAIDEIAESVAESLKAGSAPAAALPDPVGRLLLRRPPRLSGGAALPPVVGDDYVTAITRAVELMEGSTLAVQGPPGTGKTYVGSRVIKRLVDRGWSIGVVSQGHAAVDHMLDKVVEAGVPPERVGKKTRPEKSRWRELEGKGRDRTTTGVFVAGHRGSGYVLGGTAWDFTNTNKIDRRGLDLLVVDEAGQYSLANTIAVSAAADRMLLLGDPQQLPQVSQGTHPAPVDGSALGWLSRGRTLPAQFGYFLEATRRMHPAITAQVSRHSYEGRLHAREEVTAAREMRDKRGDLVQPGVFVDLVDHAGCDVLSQPEAARVVELVEEALDWTWLDPAASRGHREMDQDDILVVAPYNAQRSELQHRLAALGLEGVRVGTVDKFQGQEAPVCIVSMTASAPEEVPRGMGFLLSPNRVNVAVSRAQWRAVIVRSPHLTDYLPATVEGMNDLGGFLQLGGR